MRAAHLGREHVPHPTFDREHEHASFGLKTCATGPQDNFRAFGVAITITLVHSEWHSLRAVKKRERQSMVHECVHWRGLYVVAVVFVWRNDQYVSIIW